MYLERFSFLALLAGLLACLAFSGLNLVRYPDLTEGQKLVMFWREYVGISGWCIGWASIWRFEVNLNK